MRSERPVQRVSAATKTAAMLWVCAAVVLAGVLGSGAAQAQAGLDQFLIRPPTVAFDPVMTPLHLQRMREMPTYRTLLGLATVRYSYGEFLLMRRGVLGGSEESNPKAAMVYETPSDQGHASTDPVGLDWNDFQNTLWLMTPVKDQGQRGTCHAEAATGLMEALLKLRSVSSGQPVVVAGQTYHINEEVDLSVEWLEFAAKKRADNGANGTTGDGGDPAYDLETLRLQGGHVPEIFWPYNPQHWQNDPSHTEPGNAEGPWNWKLVAQTTDGNPPPAVQEAINRRFSDPAGLQNYSISNLTNNADHDAGVTRLKSRLGAGLPTIISIPWPTWRMIANGCVLYVPDAAKDRSENDLWNDKESSGGKMVSKWFRGGHCIVVVGVGRAGTPAEGLFAIKNSWSRWWGKNGYGFVSEAYLKKFLGQTVSCDIQSS